jgi:UDP-3-O-[3-hydroxymyristoyl] glucosamine N-acyltransferase
MVLTLAELAALVDGQLVGDPATAISGAAIIRDAIPGQITLADKPRTLAQLAESRASAVVVGPGMESSTVPYIRVSDVHRSFARIVARFHPPQVSARTGVSPQATVHPTARIGHDCEVQAGAWIGEEVEIGEGSTIHSGVRILSRCRIGERTTLFPNVVLYENSVVGARCLLHAGVVVGGYGFGYETVQGRHQLSAQLGYTELGDDVEVGACSTIDRGTYGPTTVGEGTKIDNHVMIAHNCRIGRHNIICSQVGIAGSCTTGDYVVLAGQVGIRDHVRIGDRAVVGAQAGVMCDIPAGAHYLGSPAMPEREQMHIFAAESRLPEMRKQLKALQRMVESLAATLANSSRHDAA